VLVQHGAVGPSLEVAFPTDEPPANLFELVEIRFVGSQLFTLFI